MSIAITGASGLLGRETLKQFKVKYPSDTVIGLAYTRSQDLVKCNLLDFEATNKLIMDIKPKLIIHAAAEKRPDVAAKNPDQTRILNVEVTRNLAVLASHLNALFIYISTDYVFDGTCPPYEITDQPHPLNEYGKSKYEGELNAIKVNPATVVLRVPVLYGRTIQRNESAVNILIDTVLSSKSSIQDAYHDRYPTCIEDVARVLVDLSQKCFVDKSLNGIFQFSSEEKLTKYQMCLEIARAFGRTCEHITPDGSAPTEPTATRPKNAHLSTRRLKEIGVDVSWVSLTNWVKTNIEFI